MDRSRAPLFGVLGGALLLLAACPGVPRWDGKSVACTSDEECVARFSGEPGVDDPSLLRCQSRLCVVDTSAQGCVHVAPGGADDPGRDGLDPRRPLATLGRALEVAARRLDAGEGGRICVAGGPTCDRNAVWDLTQVETEVQAGMDIEGSFESTGWTRCADLTTEVRVENPLGVYFGPAVKGPTRFARFIVDHVQGASAGISVRGARGLLLEDIRIRRSSSDPLEQSIGLSIDRGASVEVRGLEVEPVEGVATVYGVQVIGAQVTLAQSCSTGDDGACLPCDAAAEHGLHLVKEGASADRAAGIVLVDAAGSVIDGVAVCEARAAESVGVHVEGDANGIELRGSVIEAVGASEASLGVHLACTSGVPLIESNQEILAVTSGQPHLPSAPKTFAIGVLSEATCDPILRGNAEIAGRSGSSDTDISVGVACSADEAGHASACVVEGNVRITGDDRGPVPHVTGAMMCDAGACARIVDNALLAGSSPAGRPELAVGLSLGLRAAPRVLRNRIEGGCVAPGHASQPTVGVGVWSSGSAAWLEANVISAGSCPSSTTGLALLAGGALLEFVDGGGQADLVSNTIDAGGAGFDVSAAVVLSREEQSQGRGVVAELADNYLRLGEGQGSTTLFAGSGAALLSAQSAGNLVWAPVSRAIFYTDPTGNEVVPLAQMNKAFDRVGGLTSKAFRQIDADCLALPGSDPLDPTIQAKSSCQDAGMRDLTGLTEKPLDFFGQARDDGKPDVGAHEWHPGN